MLSELKRIVKFLGGEPWSQAEKKAMMDEALLMILSRATNADFNIHPVEISTVQKLIKDKTGEDVSEKDIRVTAISTLYEDTSFDRFLKTISSALDEEDRRFLLKSLADIIRSDDNTSPNEIKFFNHVAESLGLKPSDIAAL